MKSPFEIAVETALKEPTLEKALYHIIIWEHENSLKRTSLETCFELCIKTVLKEWEEQNKPGALDISSKILNEVEQAMEAIFKKYGIPPDELRNQKPSIGSLIGKLEDPIYDLTVKYINPNP